MIRLFTRTAAAGAIVCAFVAPAFAHVTLAVQSAAVGSGYKAVFRVPHGCNGNATTALDIKIPEGFIEAKPQPKPGWTLRITDGSYVNTYTLYGSKVSSGAVEISWSGATLPDNEYDEFVVNGNLADNLKPGTKLFFPVIQTCSTGETDWIDTSGGEETPAPGLMLTPAAQ